LLALLPTALAAADRPTAPHLLPKDTLAYVRVADTPELVDRFKETAIGRIFQDEQVRPLVSQLYESAIELFREAEEKIGLSLDQLLLIPQGEICAAVVAPEKGPLAIVALIDVGDSMPFAQKILDRVDEDMARRAVKTSTEPIGGTTLKVFDMPGERERQVIHFEKGGVVVVSTNLEVTKQLLKAWAGEETPTLADNKQFTAIMRRCAGSEDEAPQISFFVDPIELAGRATRGNVGAAAGMAMLPVLGLDGVQAVGGSMAFATEEYDGIMHLHLLLDSPRSGVLEMLALRSGDTTPEPWVPSDVATYVTVNWDFDKTYTSLRTLYNNIRGEDALARDFNQKFSDQLDVDFEKDVLEALDGRVTYIAWMLRPARMNSRANLVGVKLKDAKKFRKVFDQTVTKFEKALRKEHFGGVTYYAAADPRKVAPNRPERPLMRQPKPAVAMFGDYLILTDSVEFLKYAIATKNDASQSLANQLEFKLIASKIRRRPGGEQPGLLSFDQPEEGMRLLYDLAISKDIRERLATGAENNKALEALQKALKDNPLPPFAVIAKYLAPGGSLLTNDETGFHYTSFTAKRQSAWQIRADIRGTDSLTARQQMRLVLQRLFSMRLRPATEVVCRQSVAALHGHLS